MCDYAKWMDAAAGLRSRRYGTGIPLRHTRPVAYCATTHRTAQQGVHMGARLSGGIGPFRAAIPLGPIAFGLIFGPFVLIWWMLALLYWPMRWMFFDLPRVIIRSRRTSPVRYR